MFRALLIGVFSGLGFVSLVGFAVIGIVLVGYSNGVHEWVIFISRATLETAVPAMWVAMMASIAAAIVLERTHE